MLRDILESAVGKPGRTGKKDAEEFVKNNPEVVNDFKKIVQKMGGKAVAMEILNLKIFGKSAPGTEKSTYKTIPQEDIL